MLTGVSYAPVSRSVNYSGSKIGTTPKIIKTEVSKTLKNQCRGNLYTKTNLGKHIGMFAGTAAGVAVCYLYPPAIIIGAFAPIGGAIVGRTIGNIFDAAINDRKKYEAIRKLDRLA